MMDSAASSLPIRTIIARMRPYVPGEQRRGAVVKLNTNENPYPPSPQAVAAIQAALADGGECARRYPDPQATELRGAIAEAEGLTPEQVIVGNGSDEVLRLLFHITLNPGDPYGILAPTYTYYQTLASGLGGAKVEHELDADLRLPPSLLSGEERILLIANPNPPFGTLYSTDALAKVTEARRDALIVVDEAYIAFAPEGSSAAALVGHHSNLVVTRSFSKSHALAGLRIGFGLASLEIIEALNRVRDSYNVNAVSQTAALAALRDTEHHAQTRSRVIAERERLVLGLVERDFAIPPSHGNFVFAFHERAPEIFAALGERNILVRHFDAPRTRLGLRITVGLPEQTDALLAALDEIQR